MGRRQAPRARGMRGPKARRGDVRAAILSVLSDAPRNGYQVIQEIAERTGGAWKPSPGSIYPTLQQLNRVKCLGATGGSGIGGRTHVRIAQTAFLDERGEMIARRIKNMWDRGCDIRIVYDIENDVLGDVEVAFNATHIRSFRDQLDPGVDHLDAILDLLL